MLNQFKKKLAKADPSSWLAQCFSSSFTLISGHTNFHDPRTTPSGRKVIRRSRKKKERGGKS
jgi:hypothetical protein